MPQDADPRLQAAFQLLNEALQREAERMVRCCELDTMLAQRSGDLAGKEAEIAKLQAEIVAKDAKIEDLTAKLAAGTTGFQNHIGTRKRRNG